jgi:gas vesicle protein
MATTAQSNQGMNMFGMVVVAAAAGAIAGMLFAPKRGTEMRQDINRRVMDMTSKAEDQFAKGADTMKNKAQMAAEKTRVAISRTADKTKDTISDAADKTKSVADKAADATKDAADETAAQTRRHSNTSS